MPNQNTTQNENIKCPRKALVSYLWITMFTGFAAKYGADNLKIIMDSQGFFPLTTFAVPIIFFVTLFRFSIGNILHLRRLEERDSPSYVWVLDFLVILLEAIIFLLLGGYSYGNNFRFFQLFILLMFIDSIWIASMHIYKEKRPQIPHSWGLLNGISALALVGIIVFTLYDNKPYFESFEVICGLFIWFLLCAVIDLCADHYNLWRVKKKKGKSPAS